MSYHILDVATTGSFLGCKDEQLLFKAEQEERQLPLEDVAAIIVSSLSATIHSHLLRKAAQYGVVIVFCENHRPCSILLPANRNTDTTLTRAVVGLNQKQKARLWEKTVNAKCANQFALADSMNPPGQTLKQLRRIAFDAKLHKEAMCAKMYWKAIGEVLGDEAFRRDPKGGGLNALLNYGYAVLLSALLQRLMAVGLDPTFGIGHYSRERATPLGYDLMEPFRPLVDRVALRILLARSESHQSGDEKSAITKDEKTILTAILKEPLEYAGAQRDLLTVLEHVGRSFRRAVLENRVSAYRPWIPKNLKWDG